MEELNHLCFWPYPGLIHLYCTSCWLLAGLCSSEVSLDEEIPLCAMLHHFIADHSNAGAPHLGFRLLHGSNVLGLDESSH